MNARFYSINESSKVFYAEVDTIITCSIRYQFQVIKFIFISKSEIYNDIQETNIG